MSSPNKANKKTNANNLNEKIRHWIYRFEIKNINSNKLSKKIKEWVISNNNGKKATNFIILNYEPIGNKQLHILFKRKNANSTATNHRQLLMKLQSKKTSQGNYHESAKRGYDINDWLNKLVQYAVKNNKTIGFKTFNIPRKQ